MVTFGKKTSKKEVGKGSEMRGVGCLLASSMAYTFCTSTHCSIPLSLPFSFQNYIFIFIVYLSIYPHLVLELNINIIISLNEKKEME